ncbi:MAG: hypothetical protein CMJ52_09615 [Planctomycetaceae bacterium]|nr:hypothetical protein [Planctomycetaceae bacterium]
MGVNTQSQDRTAIIGDVHGCAEELEELLDVTVDLRSVSRVVLTGDLLTKGPDPAGTVRILEEVARRGLEVASVCGNQDLRLSGSLGRLVEGGRPRSVAKADRLVHDRLVKGGMVDAAVRLLADTVERVEIRVGDATVLHAGIDPALGLAATDPHDKIHLKPGAGRRPWWLDYDGTDGLVICGHRPVASPIRSARGERPVAVNVDTGCVGGGSLTAYILETDEFISVESRQVPGRAARGGIVAPTAIEAAAPLARGRVG